MAKQSYLDRSTLYNLDGQSKNCHFDQSKGVCGLYRARAGSRPVA